MPSPYRNATAALCLFIVSPTSGQSTQTPDIDDLSWRVTVDGVMGGLSTGRVRETELGDISFTGNISLENNGGFSQISAPIDTDTFADASGIELRVKGDGREFTFDARTENARWNASSFQRTFGTLDGQWLTIHLPFDDFAFYAFGERVANAPFFDTARINNIGITLADKRDGEFELVIDSIEPYTNENTMNAPEPAPHEATPERAMRIIQLAIERGVPLFNAGQHQACAAIYEIAAESVISMGTDTIGEDAGRILSQGLSRAEKQSDPAERAWTYRRALDAATLAIREIAARDDLHT